MRLQRMIGRLAGLGAGLGLVMLGWIAFTAAMTWLRSGPDEFVGEVAV